MLDIQGSEFERMQDYANANRPNGAPPVYIIPGHKMMAQLYDDIQAGIVPGITNINQFFSDNIHTNELGAYAISMIHYASIFNKSPVGLPHNLLPNAPQGTLIPSPALAEYLQKMIWKVVSNYPRTGIREVVNHTDNFKDGDKLFVFPNPADDYIILSENPYLTNFPFFIYNQLGERVYSGNENKINLSEFPAGIYFLKKGSEIKKFLKVKAR
jgi:hypothetical protein